MTTYHLGGVPIWRYALKFVIPPILLILCFYCGRSCVRSQMEGLAVTLMPPVDKGTRFVSGIRDIEPLSMDDSRWSSQSLGASGRVVLNSGDSLLCVAMGLKILGVEMTPNELAEGLPPDAFTGTGRVVWERIAEHPKLKNRIALRDKGIPSSDDLDEAIERRRILILLVTPDRNSPAQWVMLAGRTPKYYMVMDPKRGKNVSLDRFHNAATHYVCLEAPSRY